MFHGLNVATVTYLVDAGPLKSLLIWMKTSSQLSEEL